MNGIAPHITSSFQASGAKQDDRGQSHDSFDVNEDMEVDASVEVAEGSSSVSFVFFNEVIFVP